MMWGKWRIYDRGPHLIKGWLMLLPEVYGVANSAKKCCRNSTGLHKQQMLERILVLGSCFSPLIMQYYNLTGLLSRFSNLHPSSVAPLSLLGPDPLKVTYDNKAVLKKSREKE